MQADLSVNAKSWPKQLPPGEYVAHNYYGSGQAGSFHDAIHGGNSITEQEMEEVNKLLPEKETKRWYLKGGIHKSTSKVISVKNKSTATTNNYNTASLYSPKHSKDVTGGQIGAGYIFDKFRVDVDYIFCNKATYNQSPLFTLGNPNITSKITGHHLIANAYYDFQELYLFKPFIGVSAGFGINKVSSTFTNSAIANSNGVEKSKSTTGIDYGLQLGARIRIAKTKFHACASYRYLNLGKAKWVDNSGTLMLAGKRTFNGFCLDLIYLL